VSEPAPGRNPLDELRAALTARGETEWMRRLQDALGASTVSSEILGETRLVLDDLRRHAADRLGIAGRVDAAIADVDARLGMRPLPTLRGRRWPPGLLLGLLMASVLLPLAAVELLAMRDALREHQRDLRLATTGERREGIVVEAGRSTPEDGTSVAWSRVEVTFADGARRVFNVEAAHEPGDRVPMLVSPSTREGDGAEVVARRLRQWPFSFWMVSGVAMLLFEIGVAIYVWLWARAARRHERARTDIRTVGPPSRHT